MVTITLHCPRCLSDALVRNGHAPNGKQLYRCRACGRQSRQNPTPHAYPEARREEILHARPRTQQPARSHAHIWRLSHDGVVLDQKKGSQLPLLSTTLVAPDPENPTSTRLELDERMARLGSKKPTTPGYGSLSAVTHGKWSPMQLGIEVKKRVSGCGRPFLKGIATGIVSLTSGQPTRR